MLINNIVVRLGEIQLTVHGVVLVLLPAARLPGPSSVGVCLKSFYETLM